MKKTSNFVVFLFFVYILKMLSVTRKLPTD